MDVGKLKLQGEWLELEAKDKKIGSLKFRLLPADVDETFDDLVGAISRYVVEWDLTDGDKPVKCDKENKAKYLPFLLRIELAGEDGKKRFIGSEIIEFVSNIENFVKN